MSIRSIARRLTVLLALAVACGGLNACSSMSSPKFTAVEQAYNTYGVVPVKPYRRTIFSSTDF